MNKNIEQSTFVIALFLLLSAIASTLFLASLKLGLVDEIPGCGPQSGCDVVTNTKWGYVPLLHVPISFVGIAWFTGLLITYTKCGVTKQLLWCIRIGVLASLGFIGIMFFIDAFCKYCMIAHLCNVFFWICAEIQRRSGKDGGGLVLLVASCITITTGLLFIGIVVDHEKAEENRALAEENAEEILEADVSSETLALLDATHIIGSPDAPIQITMFTDYQCPDCSRIEKQLEQIVESRDDVAVWVKHFPMNYECNDQIGTFKLHPNACWAARAAEAASILGGSDGWEMMHRWLFENRGSFTDASFPPALQSMGFEPSQFIEVMMSEDTLKQVQEDAADGFELGLYFTPMVFINGVEYLWYYGNARSLSSVIEQVALQVESGDTEVAAPPSANEKLVEDWRRGHVHPNRLFEHASWLGDAEFEVVVWGDYHSNFSTELDTIIRTMMKDNPHIKYAFRQFPVDELCNKNAGDFQAQNEGSCFTAQALESVSILGGDEARWEFHNWLVENRTALHEPLVLAKASEITNNPQNIIQDVMTSIEVNDRIQKDIVAKQNVWRKGIPVLTIDGRYVPRWRTSTYSAEELLQRIFDSLSEEAVSTETSR
ncbi:MAG: thioredoxin domain-containing protein [Phycisphaerales bacterium]|nr:thioredoxin domain-containing protein [Phycisphaerales bacterium]